MANIVGQLLLLLCQHRCSPASVASSLTFLPPDPPYYRIVRDSGKSNGGEGENRREVSMDQNEDGELIARGNMEEDGWRVEFQPIVYLTPFDNIKVVKLTTSKGNCIPALIFRHPVARYTVLFSHGNAADLGSMRERYVQLCIRMRVNVLAYDYSGYGEASGLPSEDNTYSDINAAYDHLLRSGICKRPEREIVLYGQSVGSGPSVRLASSRKRPVRALILHSPIMSGIRVLLENRGPLCCCDIYPNLERIRGVDSPVLVIHGDYDEEVGFHHGMRIHQAVPMKSQREPLWVRGAGHNNIVEEFPEKYYPRVARFFDELEAEDRATDEFFHTDMSMTPT